MMNQHRHSRVARLTAIAALLGSTMVAALSVPSTASATPNYELLKTSNFAASEPAGWHTCQQEPITLPTLSSDQRYAWSEDFPQANNEYLINYHQSFHGKFEWTVCVASMKGQPHSNAYSYYEYSMLTTADAACQNQGKCTTYELATYYIYTGGNNELWGSELSVVPSTYCSYEACEETGGVSVSTS